jgi:hypothetical protein
MQRPECAQEGAAAPPARLSVHDRRVRAVASRMFTLTCITTVGSVEAAGLGCGE